jgi:hypothetical protein
LELTALIDPLSAFAGQADDLRPTLDKSIVGEGVRRSFLSLTERV